MLFQGLNREDARAAFKPLLDFVNANAADYGAQASPLVLTAAARRFWDADYLRKTLPLLVPDNRPGAAATDFWWTGDGEQVGGFWHAFTSAWMPASLLEPPNQGRLVDAWFAASRQWPVEFHFNKGLAGAPAAALAAARDTAINPEVVDAFALALSSDAGPSLYTGAAPDLAAARARAARVQAAMTALRAAAPGAGAYVNEADYFQTDWQNAFWGSHYPRLSRIKRRYDPNGLFTVHHGVGSEAWSPDGFTRVA
jgi:FAD/FMN-containing dehydrogenase